MEFIPTPLAGAYIIKPEMKEDERGFFARSYCRNEFLERDLNPKLVQCNISYNKVRGTLRGMHCQLAPYQEVKLVRCTRGAVYDVIIDLRADSPTFKGWHGVELSATNCLACYVPEGFAHGFLTLADKSEVLYHMSTFFSPEAAFGVRWNDPAFGISWPEDVRVISKRDGTYADFSHL
jgi:dTDP-4-dehydrorhamnose 3,5-epimerase